MKIKKKYLLAFGVVAFSLVVMLRGKGVQDDIMIYNLAVGHGDLKQMCEYSLKLSNHYKNSSDRTNFLKWIKAARSDCQRTKI